MTKYYKDFTGVTARITEHRDGTATLKISTEKKARKYKNANRKKYISIARKY